MSYFLLVSIAVALIAILYVWYMSRGINSFPDDKPLSLETNEDKLLTNWFNMNIKHSFDFNVNDFEIASKYLLRIYDIEVDPNLLVVGTNLESQYSKLTHHSLETKYSPNVDCIFDIRPVVGRDGEIAIIQNAQVRSTLRRNTNSNLSELNTIIDSELDLIARDYLREVLKFRWEQIIQLNDPNVINREGSYLYFRTNNISLPTPGGLGSAPIFLAPPSQPGVGARNDTPVPIMEGIIAMMTPQGYRLNLLCSNLEFDTLIKRWKSHLHATQNSALNV